MWGLWRASHFHTERVSIPALFDTQQISLIKITPLSSTDEFLESVKEGSGSFGDWVSVVHHLLVWFF